MSNFINVFTIVGRNIQSLESGSIAGSPTFFALPAVNVVFNTDIVSSLFGHQKFDMSRVFQDELYTEIFENMPAAGPVTTKAYVGRVTESEAGGVSVIINCK